MGDYQTYKESKTSCARNDAQRKKAEWMARGKRERRKEGQQGFYGAVAPGGNVRVPGVAGDCSEWAIIAPSAFSISATEPALSLFRPQSYWYYLIFRLYDVPT